MADDDTCLACGAELVEPLWSISHTIRRGAKLCPDCGLRESTDPVWADGLRIGFERDVAARKVIKAAEAEEEKQ